MSYMAQRHTKELDMDKEMCLLPSSDQLRTSGMKSRS